MYAHIDVYKGINQFLSQKLVYRFSANLPQFNAIILTQGVGLFPPKKKSAAE